MDTVALDKNNLRARVDALLDGMIERFYQVAPLGGYQKDAAEIDLNYFVRHSIETVLRIRHKRMIDALVIHYFTKHNPRLAKAWANYTEDEMLHGHMFARDLQKLAGLTIEEIYQQYEPLFSTKLLNGYFYFTLEHEGPMAAITSAYFLEYTTRKTQPVWLDNLERVFGKENLMGARGHVNHDIRDNHNDFVWDVLAALINNEEDEARFFMHLNHIYGLFVAYFQDVYQQTLASNDQAGIEKITLLAVKEANHLRAVTGKPVYEYAGNAS
ncbi:hypothetical protein [Aquicella lusitana]|uniref:Heme oxygenase-like protein n=1 Tax=Aquicella lusitana TaxID=254246 RepID=A0A370GYC2_9COXI|nr:hypothetical protein [Aquicella lusitana]RDI48648.1 hypothetical protein C8D86_10276 [Aquicella lusitana]VVC73975.1 hypothetical protein AQULUS_17370 [Aquicella lusitana]